jgi:pyridoxamine 5'-phosphate oxidase
LEQRFREYDRKYPGENVPLPPFWGGWRLEPQRIEFWQGRLNRLHDRLRYDRKGAGWEITRLNP